MYKKISISAQSYERLVLFDDAAESVTLFGQTARGSQTMDVLNEVTSTDIVEIAPTFVPIRKLPAFRDFASSGVGIDKVSDYEVTLSGFGDVMEYGVCFECSVKIDNNIPIVVSLVVDDKIYGSPKIIYADDTPVFFGDVVVVPPNSTSTLAIHLNQQLRTKTQHNRYVATLAQLPICSNINSVISSNNSPHTVLYRLANLSLFPIL